MKYTVAMSVRTACLILTVVIAMNVTGLWWMVPGLGAVVLPYIAVVLANAGSSGAMDPIRPLDLHPLALPPGAPDGDAQR